MTKIVIAMDHDGCADYYTTLRSEQNPTVQIRGELLEHIVQQIKNVLLLHPNADIYISCLSARQSYQLNKYNSLKSKNLSSHLVLEALAITIAKRLNKTVFFDTNLLADSINEPGANMQEQFAQYLEYHESATTHAPVIINIYRNATQQGYLSQMPSSTNMSFPLKLARLRQITSMFPLGELVYLFCYDDFEKYLTHLLTHFNNPIKYAWVKAKFYLVDPFDFEEQEPPHDELHINELTKPGVLDTQYLYWHYQHAPQLSQAILPVEPSKQPTPLEPTELNSLMATQYIPEQNSLGYLIYGKTYIERELAQP